MRKITIITGHYGAGKTNISVNLALKLSEKGEKVTVVDLDIVNPYFRTADFNELFMSNNIELIKPLYANTNLDIPAINFDLERIIKDNRYTIIDVGGDDAGAAALGRFYEALIQYKDDLNMFYVVNCYRFLTRTSQEALELMYEIEATSRLKHTGIINNSNLGVETTIYDIQFSMKFAGNISDKANIPLIFTAYKRGLDVSDADGKFIETDIYVKPLWED